MSPPKRDLAPFPVSASQSDALATPLIPQTLRRRQNVSLACSECRASRKKCSGEPAPCKNCALSGLDCRFDPDSDARRNSQRESDVDYFQNLTSRLMQVIRRCDLSTCDRVLSVIRQTVSLREIALAIDEALQQLDVQLSQPALSTDPSELQATQRQERPDAENHIPRRQNTMQLENLVHVPRLDVPATPWTAVVGDSRTVSDLITLYFTWCHPFLQIVDRDSFVEDMQAATSESPFVSGLLVNALLALGCHFYNRDTPRDAEPETPLPSEEFYLEAKRLWLEQGAKPSLTNVQGLSALTLEYFFRGEDRVAWMTLAVTNHIYQELRTGLNTNMRARTGSAAFFQKLETSLPITASGVYCLNMVISNALLKPIMKNAPVPTDFLNLKADGGEIEWSAFPSPKQARPFQLRRVLLAFAGLAEIQSSCLDLLFDDRDRSDLPEFLISVEAKYGVLKQWYDGLADDLRIGDRSAPAIIDLHLTYHHITLILFNFIDIPEQNHDQASPQYNAQARAQTIDAALQIASLCAIFRREYSLRRVTITILQSANIGTHCLLSHLDDVRSHNALVMLCQILSAARSQWAIARGFMRMLEPTAAHIGVTLPDEVLKVLRESEPSPNSWHAEDSALFNSSYPNYTVYKTRDDDLSPEMGELLKRWEGFYAN